MTSVLAFAIVAGLAGNSIPVTPNAGFERAQAPSVAISNAGKVFVAFGQGDTLYCAQTDAGFASFGTPVPIGTIPHIALGMRRGPRIAIEGKCVVVTAVGGEKGGGADGDLLAWRSSDEGMTWAGPVRVNDVPGSAREGLHAMASNGGAFVCIWLDLRAKGTQLYSSVSTDGGATWGANHPVYRSPSGTICQCCTPSLAPAPGGEFVAMWRNLVDGARDMHAISLTSQGEAIGKDRKLGDESWILNACPMDGGGIASAPDGSLLAIYRRRQEVYSWWWSSGSKTKGSPTAQLPESGKETLLGNGEQGVVAVGSGGPVFAWLQRRQGPLMVVEGGFASPRIIADSASDPVTAALPGGKRGTVLVWVDFSGPSKIRALKLE